MHAAAYHIQDVLDKFKNLKQFSGQGVEKNNDVARSIVLRKSNNFDSPAVLLPPSPSPLFYQEITSPGKMQLSSLTMMVKQIIPQKPDTESEKVFFLTPGLCEPKSRYLSESDCLHVSIYCRCFNVINISFPPSSSLTIFSAKSTGIDRCFNTDAI
ncbi:Hypothetical predicted protein, partial [Paramuricea clavata]